MSITLCLVVDCFSLLRNTSRGLNSFKIIKYIYSKSKNHCFSIPLIIFPNQVSLPQFRIVSSTVLHSLFSSKQSVSVLFVSYISFGLNGHVKMNGVIAARSVTSISQVSTISSSKYLILGMVIKHE